MVSLLNEPTLHIDLEVMCKLPIIRQVLASDAYNNTYFIQAVRCQRFDPNKAVAFHSKHRYQHSVLIFVVDGNESPNRIDYTLEGDTKILNNTDIIVGVEYILTI